MNDQKCIVFAGNASKRLASEIAPTSPPAIYSDIINGKIHHQQFPSGEWYCQLQENVRGADVFLLQSVIKPANDNLMQLLIMADAARRASAGRITAIVPYMGYSRQDRNDKSRVPISAKLVMNILQTAGVDRYVTMDLHAQQIQGFTDLPFDHLYFQPVLMEAMKHIDIDVVCSPDIGGIKKAVEYAKKVKKEFAFVVKQRKDETTVEVIQFVGNVKDKGVLIVDDLTESAGTLIAGAKECRVNGAKKIYCAVTHACLDTLGISRLDEAYKSGVIDKFYCSDTVIDPKTLELFEWATVVSIKDIFGKAIHAIHNNQSISSLFS